MKQRAMMLMASSAAFMCVMTGCSAHPGVAVKVGNETYSERDVSAVAADLRQLSGQNIPVGKVVSYLVTATLIREVGAKHGVVIDDQAAHAKIQEIVDKSKGKVRFQGAVSQPFVDLMKQDLVVNEVAQRKVSNKILQDEFNKAKSSDQIIVNPKYGTIDDDLATRVNLLADVVTGRK